MTVPFAGKPQRTAFASIPVDLAHAQLVLDVHVMVLADGSCLGCGTALPCAVRNATAEVFVRHGRLPRRRPGASRPELVGARSVLVSGSLRLLAAQARVFAEHLGSEFEESVHRHG